jgi:hypothetical protein
MENEYFCVDCLRRLTRKIGAHFLYGLELLTVTIKNLGVTINRFSSSAFCFLSKISFNTKDALAS